MNCSLGLLTDPFVAGRGESAAPSGRRIAFLPKRTTAASAYAGEWQSRAEERA